MEVDCRVVRSREVGLFRGRCDISMRWEAGEVVDRIGLERDAHSGAT